MKGGGGWRLGKREEAGGWVTRKGRLEDRKRGKGAAGEEKMEGG
jgi:hypothetical protein